MTVEDIKRRVNIKELLESYGIQIHKAGKMNCIFHAESQPSMQLYPDTNRYYCFGCTKCGDIFDLVMKLERCSFPVALERLKSHAGKKSQQSPAAVEKAPTTGKQMIMKKNQITDARKEEIYSYLYDQIKLTYKGREYLLSRGLKQANIDIFRIKSINDPFWISKRLKEHFSVEELQAAGLLNGNGTIAFWKPAVVIPYWCNDHIVYYSTRNYDNKPKCFKLGSIPEQYYIGTLNNDEVVVFEGIFDALSYYQMIGKDNYIAVNGSITDDKIKRIKAYYNGKLILCFDNDVKGALDRWELEDHNSFSALDWKDYIPADQDVYRKMKMNFENYNVAGEYFRSDNIEKKDRAEYVSAIKDYNDLIKTQI